MFQCSVHRNGNLSEVEKFVHLKSCLRGDAAKAIHGMLQTSSNYSLAIAVLQERYGNEAILKKAYLDRLTQLPPVVASAKSLRHFIDHISINVRLLENVKVDLEHYDVMMASLMLNKIPHTLRLEVLQVAGDCLDFKSLMRGLEMATSLRENCDNMTQHVSCSADTQGRAVANKHADDKSDSYCRTSTVASLSIPPTGV